MKNKKVIYLVLIILGLILIPLITKIRINTPIKYDALKIAILKTKYKNSPIAYPIGFNYEIANIFCKNGNTNNKIIVSNKNYLDSLNNNIDIVIMPYDDSLLNNYLVSKKLYDNSVWVVNKNNIKLMKQINKGLAHIEASASYQSIIKRFSNRYNPYGNITYENLSPYDKIIKENADKIGWDWRLLIALIYKESQFKIGVQSHKGAKGLMQLMPHAAKQINPVDPKQCIETGCNYIKRLKKIFSKHTSPNSLDDIVLAAYNAGEGKILYCIKYAKQNNLPYQTWNDLETVIKKIQQDSTATFNGSETISYVNDIKKIYSELKTMKP